MSLNRVWIGSPNYSARNANIRLVVLHTAQGARTYQELGNYFANPAMEYPSSSHVGIDDSPGVVGEYVRREHKAWTAANANPVAVQAELCGWAEWDGAEWSRHESMLDNTAQWVAEECGHLGIPITRLSPAQAQGGGTGVCQHSDLGAWGGGHWDCGPAFPIDQVLDMARGQSPRPTKKKGRTMIASTESGRGYWTTTSDGGVYAFGDAQFRGSSFDIDPITPGAQAVKVTGEIVGIAGVGNDGYWLLASDGGIFSFGSAQFYGRPDRV